MALYRSTDSIHCMITTSYQVLGTQPHHQHWIFLLLGSHLVSLVGRLRLSRYLLCPVASGSEFIAAPSPGSTDRHVLPFLFFGCLFVWFVFFLWHYVITLTERLLKTHLVILAWLFRPIITESLVTKSGASHNCTFKLGYCRFILDLPAQLAKQEVSSTLWKPCPQKPPFL